MNRVRLLVGTRKGGFILQSDSRRQEWQVSQPLFPGWEVFHINASPLNPDRLYASQSSGWFGQVLQRSDDGGQTWQAVGNAFNYMENPGNHLGYEGEALPWKFKRIWQLQPSLTQADEVYAGAEDAALFRSQDSGLTWQELSTLRQVKGELWQPGAGGLCLHTILLDKIHPGRIFVAISAAGAFRSDDGGASWKAINQGLKSPYELPDESVEVGHCVHNLAFHPDHPEVLYMQKHWDVLRSQDAGEHWTEVSGNLPSDFGFPIAVHAHEPQTVYVIPIKSDSEHYPPEGKLRVYRSRTGGNEWQALTDGLPQQDCYVNVLRSALAVDQLDPCGLYFGTSGGQVYASADSGDHWQPIVHDLPPVLSVEVQALP